jgi:hypothetical protein
MAPKRKASTSQRKLNFDAHGKDSAHAIVVIDEEEHIPQEDDDMRSRDRKRSSSSFSKQSKLHHGMDSFVSPKKEIRSTPSAIVTPAEEPKHSGSLKDASYIPTYIHRNVDYLRRNEATGSLSPIKARIVQWILDHYDVPIDIEQNRTFGPLSGSSYEDRLIAAYSLGKLVRRSIVDDSSDSAMICTACAETGHVRAKCPTLV